MAKKQIELSPEEFDRRYGGGGKASSSAKELSAEEFDQQYGAKQPNSSALEAAAQGVGNAASMGYAAPLAAGVERAASGVEGLINKATGISLDKAKETDRKLVAAGFKIDQPEESYVKTRDEFLKRQESLKKEHPYAYGIGEVAGTVGGGMGAGKLIGKALPSLAVKAGEKLLPTVAKSAAQGGLLAGLSDPGTKEGVVDPLQLKQRAKMAKTGAIVGGAIPLVAKAISGLAGFGKKLLSEGSGIPRGDIETYAKRTKEVNDLIKRSGGNLVEMSDDVRGEIQNGLQTYKKGLNESISQELAAIPEDRVLPIDPLINKIAKIQGQMNPRLHGAEYKALSELGDKVIGESVDGKVSAKAMHELKRWLQDEGDQAYLKAGQIFSKGDYYARAAKDAASEARELVSAASDMMGQSKIRVANESLAELHEIEDLINKNLITPGKPEAALLAAGSGGNQRNTELLGKLGSLTGQDIKGKAELLSAAKQFANPSWLPIDSTGKSGTRLVAGLLTGSALGMSQGKTTEGAAMGAAVTSPMAVKGAINLASSLPASVKGIPGSVGKIASPAVAGFGVGQAMGGGFQRDPLVQMSESPDNVKYAVESKQIPEEAIKTLVGWSGPLTREQYIKAATRLQSVQGRKAFQAALMHVMSVDNPEMSLGPAGQQVLGGGQ